MIIGMFHTRKNPDKVSRAYLYDVICRAEGVRFIYFTARGVNFKKRTIQGRSYQGGRWLWYECPFPDVFINNVSPKTPFQASVYNRLKQMIPVTSYAVGPKIEVYNRLKKAKEFEDYLIPYALMENPKMVIEFVNIHKYIILKPISGHHGENLVAIKKQKEDFNVRDLRGKYHLTKTELLAYLETLTGDMVMQKFIKCELKTGAAYDFRINLQKDEKGVWAITMIYPKIGSHKRIATNLSQGGLTTLNDRFLTDEFSREYYNIKRYLEVFSLRFADHFETLYPHEFDELGLDVGLDHNQKLWIYEVNWCPGHVFYEVATAKQAIKYAIFLVKRQKNSEGVKQ